MGRDSSGVVAVGSFRGLFASFSNVAPHGIKSNLPYGTFPASPATTLLFLTELSTHQVMGNGKDAVLAAALRAHPRKKERDVRCTRGPRRLRRFQFQFLAYTLIFFVIDATNIKLCATPSFLSIPYAKR